MENSRTEIFGMKDWRGIDIFGNSSTKHHSVTKNLELSQTWLGYFLEIRTNEWKILKELKKLTVAKFILSKTSTFCL